MKFEYEITKHPAKDFTQLVYYCSDKGECTYDDLPSEQIKSLQNILNQKGAEGWELIQAFFGEDGIVAFWKREI
jgi:hypothetical protein